MRRARVTVLEDGGDTHIHNKCAVVDSFVTVTGGLNFSDFAEDNADNLVFIESEQVARRFTQDWRRNAKFAE